VLAGYMPRPLSDAEIDALIAEAMAATGATGTAGMGKVMAELKPRLAGARGPCRRFGQGQGQADRLTPPGRATACPRPPGCCLLPAPSRGAARVGTLPRPPSCERGVANNRRASLPVWRIRAVGQAKPVEEHVLPASACPAVRDAAIAKLR